MQDYEKCSETIGIIYTFRNAGTTFLSLSLSIYVYTYTECSYFRQHAVQSLYKDINDNLLLETSRALFLPQLPTVVVHLEKGFQTNIRC